MFCHNDSTAVVLMCLTFENTILNVMGAPIRVSLTEVIFRVRLLLAAGQVNS